MKKILLFLALISGTAFGQTEINIKPHISVAGTAKTQVVPDMTQLSIHISVVKMKMADATKTLGEQTQQYMNILKQLGFAETEVKTTNFYAAKNRLYRHDKVIDSGYVVSQNLTLKFKYDQPTLQKIVARFSDTKDPVNFSIYFYLSDALKDKTQAELQTKAVADARRKADNLSLAAGVKVGSVKSINYGTESMPIMYSGYESKMSLRGDSGNDGAELHFAPEEQELTESVAITWFIEQ